MKFIAAIILLFMLALFIFQWRSMNKAQQMIGRKAPDTSALEGALEEGRRVYFFLITYISKLLLGATTDEAMLLKTT